MVVIYACLATMCFIQTFDFMTRDDRYVSYFKEVTYHVVFTIYLFRSEGMRGHFRRSTPCVFDAEVSRLRRTQYVVAKRLSHEDGDVLEAEAFVEPPGPVVVEDDREPQVCGAGFDRETLRCGE